jgi:uncharacterized protein (DUF1697 family)
VTGRSSAGARTGLLGGRSSDAGRPHRFVVLLRAVNVGGRTVKMAEVAAALSSAGFRSVRTLGASGNAVVEARGGPKGSEVEALVETSVRERLGLETLVVARTPEEWDRLVEANPFVTEAATDPGHLLVTVLKGSPARAAWAALNASIEGRERVAPGEGHAYIVYPDGVGRSKLTAVRIEQQLGVRGTSRNWNTVLRLQELLRA